PCALTKLCSDSHHSPARCARLRMHLRLRQTRLQQASPPETTCTGSLRKSLNLLQFSTIATITVVPANVAADVHLSSVENSGETRRAEKSPHRRRLTCAGKAHAKPS